MYAGGRILRIVFSFLYTEYRLIVMIIIANRTAGSVACFAILNSKIHYFIFTGVRSKMVGNVVS